MARKPKFTIATLLLLMALAGISTSHLLTSRALRQLQNENVRLRDQLGILTVTDDSKVHVMSIPLAEKNAWRWRIHVPEGIQLSLGIADNGIIPARGTSTPKTRAAYFEDPIPPGEHLVDAKLYRDGEGVWTVSVRTTDGTMTYSLKNADVPWLDGTAFFRTRTGSSSTRAFDTGATIPLLRHTVAKHDSMPGHQTQPPGIMIWLESKPSLSD